MPMPSSSPTECSPTATLVGQQSRCNSLSSASAGFDAGPHGAKHAFPILPPTSQRLSDATSALSNRSTSGTDAEEGRPNFAGAGTATDPFVVRWLEGEKENPLEWSPLRRWLIVLNVSMGTLCELRWGDGRSGADGLTFSRLTGVAFGSSVYAGGIAPMVRYFGVSPVNRADSREGDVLTRAMTRLCLPWDSAFMFWGLRERCFRFHERRKLTSSAASVPFFGHL